MKMRQRHGLLIHRVPSNCGINPVPWKIMMLRMAKLIGIPSWCNLAATSGLSKSPSIGENINIPLSMDRWMMNCFRILSGVIARVRRWVCVISARWLAILASMMIRCWSIISVREVFYGGGLGHDQNRFW